MLYILEKLFQEGEGTIDFLRGAESYKEMLTDQSTTNLRLKAVTDGRVHVKQVTMFETDTTNATYYE